MTKAEKHIAELEDYIRRDAALIQFYQRWEHSRDEQIAAERMAGVEKELRRLARLANGNGKQAGNG